MSEVTPPNPPTLRSAALFGATILLGLAALIPVLASDRADRHPLETTAETTAVGDQALLKHRAKSPPPELFFHGKPLVPVSPRHVEVHDTKMIFHALEDGGTLRLYTTTENVPLEPGEALQKGPVYYLKVEPNEYLRVQ